MNAINTLEVLRDTMADDINQDKVDDLIAAIERLGPSFQRTVLQRVKQNRELERANADEVKARKSFVGSLREHDRKMQELDGNFQRMTKSAESAVEMMGRLSQQGSGFLGLGVLTVLTSRGMELSKSWQGMMSIGHSFGGSMLNMVHSAASAGLSIDQFADIQKRHNVLIGSTSKDFYAMQLQLRKNISAQGSYGMTVDQINNFMGEHMESQRRNGSLETKSSKSVVKEMGSLMVTTQALAYASDKTSEEIMKLAASATSSGLAIAQMKMIPEAIRGVVDDSLRVATTGFAALPGQAGEFFSQFFADSFGGMAVLTDQGSTMIEAGLGGMVAEMDYMAQKFKTGGGTIDDQINYQNRFIDAVDANLPVLRAQAMAGNAAAKQMIEMQSVMKKTTRAELEANKAKMESTDLFTGFFGSLESMYSLLTTGFTKKFIEAFGTVFKPMSEFAESDTFKTIQVALEELGTQLGTFIGTTLSNMSADEWKNLILGIGAGIATFSRGVIMIAGAFGWIASTVMSVFGGLIWTVDQVAKLFNTTGTQIGKWIGILGAALYLGSKIWKGFGRVMGSMSVRAAVVNINGGTINGGDGGGFGGGGKGKGILSRTKAGWRAGGFGGAVKGLGSGVMRSVRGAGGSLRGLGGVAGGLAGLGGIAAGAAKALPFLGSAIEGAGYLFGDKAFTLKNLAKSGLALGGGALGGALGALAGGVGAPIGAVGGYTAGNALGNLLLGEDDSKSAPKADARAAALGAGGALAAGALATDIMGDGLATPKANDQFETINSTLKKNHESMTDLLSVIARKLDRTNALLSKIDISAQNL